MLWPVVVEEVELFETVSIGADSRQGGTETCRER